MNKPEISIELKQLLLGEIESNEDGRATTDDLSPLIANYFNIAIDESNYKSWLDTTRWALIAMCDKQGWLTRPFGLLEEKNSQRDKWIAENRRGQKSNQQVWEITLQGKMHLDGHFPKDQSSVNQLSFEEITAIQDDAQGERDAPLSTDIDEPRKASRITSTISRIVRDTKRAAIVKSLYQYKCQLCGCRLQLKDESFYAEAHHIKPLGKPHNGPDIKENIICVCPNHHALLDYGAIKLDLSQINMAHPHRIAKIFVDYHNNVIYKNQTA